MHHAGEAPQALGKAADYKQHKSEYRREQKGKKRGKQERQRGNNQELQNNEIQGDQKPTVRFLEVMGNVQQGNKNPDGHANRIYH